MVDAEVALAIAAREERELAKNLIIPNCVFEDDASLVINRIQDKKDDYSAIDFKLKFSLAAMYPIIYILTSEVLEQGRSCSRP